MRDKITFPTNVPTAVILEGMGTEQSNRAGDPEYRYFLQHNGVMWVPPEVHGAIQQTNGNNGSEYVITKQQPKRGAPVRWTVEHVADEPQAAAELRNTTTAPSSRAAIPQQPTPDAGSYERQPSQGWTYREPAPPAQTNGHRKPQPRPAPTPAPHTGPETWYHEPGEPLTGADKLAGCLAAAIDAAAEATVYAERHGLSLRWDAGDIRAMAATLMIGEQRQGRM